MRQMIRYLFFALLLISARASAQTIVGTIKPGSQANKVDIYLRPDFTNATQYFSNLIFVVDIATADITTVPTVSIATGSGIPQALTWAPIDVAVVIGSRTIWTFYALPANIAAVTFTANTEFHAATVTFSGGKPLAKVRLADYTSIDGGPSGQAYFYVELNASSQVSPSTSADMFYASGGTSTTGANYAETIANISLPLQLLSFEAKEQDKRVKLEWATASEISTAYFQVERSKDGLNFIANGSTIKAAGNSSSTLTYSTYDDSPLPGTNYYRLKMVDVDNKFTYSPVKVVKIDAQAGKIYVFPTANTTGIVYVQLPQGYEQAITTLSNVSGQQLNQRFNNAKGLNRQADLNGLPAGVYILQVQDRQSGKKESFRILYQK